MEEDSPQAVMLGLTSRATPIRRIRIQRGPGSLFTHTSNNAKGRLRFQKKVIIPDPKCLKFSNVLARSDLCCEERLRLSLHKKIRGARSAPKRRRIFCSELRSRIG